MSDNNITVASRQWATRPDDQRFLSMEELRNSVLARKRESWTVQTACRDLRILPAADNELQLVVHDNAIGRDRQIVPTNWSFSQLATFSGAPGSYLRKLPAELAAINLQWGLDHFDSGETLILGRDNGNAELRAMTGPTYGRIWDIEVVEAVQRVNADGRWKIPSASYSNSDPRRATTLYASDRDVFIFLCDPHNPVEVGKETLFRGFYTWNSEVGSATFGLTTFLYRYICDNRIIWGASSVQELKIRHTSGAPNRFAYEGARYLQRYAEESTRELQSQIQSAQQKEVKSLMSKDQTLEDWLQKRGFTKAQAKSGIERANEEEGQAASVWDLVQGLTAYARTIKHTNDRVDVETKAGKLMQLAA